MASVWYFLVPLVLVLGTVLAIPVSDDLVDAELIGAESSEIEESCPSNERFDKCRARCQRNCTNSNINPALCDQSCKPGCICNDGLVRGPEGTCIRPHECPKVSLSEEDSDDDEDEDHDEDFDSTEVSEEDLERRRRRRYCPLNEEFIPCKAHCEPNCKNKNETDTTCSFCVSGCRCKSGFVRGPEGKCILPDKCPADDKTIYPVKRDCPKPEVWNRYVAHCQGNCSTDGKLIPCVRMAVAGCICKKGLYRNDKGRCVPLKKCVKKEEAKPDWPKNETFIPCYSHCEKDCKTRNQTVPECNRTVCVSGWRCNWDLVRGPKGICIKPKECPAKDKTKYPVKRQCPPNEQWEVSKAHCQINCTNYSKPPPCPKGSFEGCVCKKGLYRGRDGKCIPKKQCPKRAEEEILDEDEVSSEDDMSAGASFCPKNEIFVPCYGHCEKDCKTRNQTVPECVKGVCVSECRCHWDYVRGPKGTCIKPQECPANDGTKYPVKRQCPPKERWEVSKAHCQINCTNSNKPPPCPKISVAGCVCDKGLYRGKDGKCIPKNQCPKKADDVLNEDDADKEDTIWNHDVEDDVLVDEDEKDSSVEEVPSEDSDSGRTCPSERKCTSFCRRRGFRYGRCVGQGRKRCFCR